MTRPDIDDAVLMAYADGEADAPTMLLVEAAMDADAAIRDRVVMFAQSALLLREAFDQMDVAPTPPALERKLRRAIWTSRGWRATRFAVPIAAAIAGFVIGGAQVPWLSGWPADAGSAKIAAMVQEVAEYHAVFVRETEHLVEVPASRRAHIEAWLGDRVGFPLRVPDLTARGLTFAGARMLAVDARPAAQLVYTTREGERVALCVTAFDKIAGTALLHLTQRGFDMYAQVQGAHLFILAAPEGWNEGKDLSADLANLLRHG